MEEIIAYVLSLPTSILAIIAFASVSMAATVTIVPIVVVGMAYVIINKKESVWDTSKFIRNQKDADLDEFEKFEDFEEE